MRSVTVALRVLEEALDRAEQLLTRGTCRCSTYEVTCAVDAPCRENVLVLIERMREKIQNLSSVLGIEPEMQDAGRQISASFFYCWEVLEGAKAGMLKRYGAVSPTLTEMLDPLIDELIGLLREAGNELLSQKQF